ncbi:MAG: DUF599 domain-containing protein [Burkholderiaceae bacterium]|nr:DUF599 domain-containing protein [Burkholderiaceae bacterium]
MSITLAWLAALGTVAVLVMYELFLATTQRRHPERLARSVNVLVRQEWFEAISQHSGSEILGVQTLRNSLMSASMTASTAALGLMGSVTLAAPSLDASFGQIQAGLPALSPRLVLELVLMALLFASLLSSAMAVRFYNHAGFICAMPVGSEARRRWGPTGVSYLRRAGLHYSWGLRHLLLVAPILVSILFPLAGPVAAVLVVLVLYGFDRLSVP